MQRKLFPEILNHSYVSPRFDLKDSPAGRVEIINTLQVSEEGLNPTAITNATHVSAKIFIYFFMERLSIIYAQQVTKVWREY